MAVYVDSAFILYRRMRMCHMLADTLPELHDMADRIGLKRDWFQGGALAPHYDICKSMRARAVKAGAIEIDRHKVAELVRYWSPRWLPNIKPISY